jgi:tRNA U34 5-methylaminomethyl-2-thiouridine-forming methyltransferase MnmC
MITQEIRVTGDGSKTIFLPELNETYHSSNGAVQESRHIFIQNGLDLVEKKGAIRILEVGFGTGLNALLTAMWAEKNNQSIHYTGIEAKPLPPDLCFQLDYPSIIGQISEKIYDELINCDWEIENQLSTHFSIQKREVKIQDFVALEPIDLIYFDAFGPRVQAEMWDITILEKMFQSLKSGGALVTYCAQGQFKRDLKAVGFQIESLPGPVGKREMTRAIKI